MEHIAIGKVKNLQAQARRVMQRLVGRELREDEQLSIRVVSPHPAPPADVRRAAADRLERIMDAAAEKAKHIPGKNVHRLLDEAIDYVRPRKKR